VYNYTDWYKSAAWPDDNYVPRECCIRNTTNCDTDHQTGNWHQMVGCWLLAVAHRQRVHRSWKVMEFKIQIFQAWKVMELGLGPGKL